MLYSQEHLKTMVYAKFGEQTECIMGNSKIENYSEYITTSVSLQPQSLKGLTLIGKLRV